MREATIGTLRREYRNCWLVERRQALWFLFRDWGKLHTNYHLSFSERIFYTIKTCALIIMHVFVGIDTDDSEAHSGEHWKHNVIMTRWNIRPSYDGESWMQVSVGYGIFKNWYYNIHPESSY